MLALQDPQQYLDQCLTALSGAAECHAILDEIPVPVYTTDARGRVTYCNRACIDVVGREPRLGRDRWCVTWRLYTTTGDRLPHEHCPMAQAVRQKKPIRDNIVIAERPDGRRMAFRPYPTPLFDDSGTLKGAVNMLIDVTEEQADALREQAAHCRHLADSTYDRSTGAVLREMADGFERTAESICPPRAG